MACIKNKSTPEGKAFWDSFEEIATVIINHEPIGLPAGWNTPQKVRTYEDRPIPAPPPIVKQFTTTDRTIYRKFREE